MNFKDKRVYLGIAGLVVLLLVSLGLGSYFMASSFESDFISSFKGTDALKDCNEVLVWYNTENDPSSSGTGKYDCLTIGYAGKDDVLQSTVKDNKDIRTSFAEFNSNGRVHKVLTDKLKDFDRSPGIFRWFGYLFIRNSGVKHSNYLVEKIEELNNSKEKGNLVVYVYLKDDSITTSVYRTVDNDSKKIGTVESMVTSLEKGVPKKFMEDVLASQAPAATASNPPSGTGNTSAPNATNPPPGTGNTSAPNATNAPVATASNPPSGTGNTSAPNATNPPPGTGNTSAPNATNAPVATASNPPSGTGNTSAPNATNPPPGTGNTSAPSVTDAPASEESA